MAKTRLNTHIIITQEMTLGGRVRQNGDKFRATELTEDLFLLVDAGSITGAATSTEHASSDNFKLEVPDVTLMYRTKDGVAVTKRGEPAAIEDDVRFDDQVLMVPADTQGTEFDNSALANRAERRRTNDPEIDTDQPLTSPV